MSSSFENSFDQYAGDSPASGNGYFVPDSFSKPDSAAAESPSPFYASVCEFASDPAYLSSEANENCPILPPPDEMDPEEGYALGEWRRQNTIRLEEKEKREKELLSKILIEAEEYKVELQGKRQLTCESNKATNREKEKIFVASQEKFHVEADKDYWKSISDLIPKELPAMEKKKKQPSMAVVKGPKPGKPTDLVRMRQILVKLNGNTPSHLIPSPSRPPASDGNNAAPKMPSAARPVAVV